MERTKVVKPNDGTILWQKTGGGSFRMSRRIIKPGEKFRARPDEIPKGFRDVVIPLEPIPEGTFNTETGATEPIIPGVSPKYTLKSRGGGWYDIVDSAGKVMNEPKKPLKKAMAEQLIKDLER